ncbi:MAG: hypothetical protein HY699_13955 [Deltaproteobacteria bacterium]|nr:hypothetical protein [Deltaproteobacteria bacterium]
MNARQLVVTVALLAAPTVTGALGPELRRVTPPNRPYIVELGEPRPMSSQGLDRERKLNSDLNLYLEYYGWPDYVEVQDIAPQDPWAAYEVRLYYLQREIEMAFGRAFIAPTITDFGVIKYQGHIEPGTRDRIVALVAPPRAEFDEPEPVEFKPVAAAAPAPAPAPPSDIEALIARVEAAAERASLAAERAAAASDAATVAADRAANIFAKISE